MEGLNIVELGNVSEETRGTMFIGVSDPGGPHYWIPPSVVQVRKMSDVKLGGDNKARRITRARDCIR